MGFYKRKGAASRDVKEAYKNRDYKDNLGHSDPLLHAVSHIKEDINPFVRVGGKREHLADSQNIK